MSERSIKITLDEPLETHALSQTGKAGTFERVEDYVKDLIRRDMEADKLSGSYLCNLVDRAVMADEAEYRQISAEDVIQRNSTLMNDLSVLSISR